ncbi:hypothetical protein ABTX60_06980 [Streptomyces sp. NPDC126510]|uniref:hypothetical protein n=1 Tax=Streptomyces sp. NPDC126510 TaxID=3155317 RepID=UPI00331E0C94
MTATLTQVFESLTESFTSREEYARTKLANCLTDLGQAVDTSLIRTAMETAAEALPYKKVLEWAKKAGLREALTDMRRDLTRQLLSRSMSSSTCQIRNEATRMEMEAAQRFLANTDNLLDQFGDAPAEEPAPAPEPQPAPASADAPKATPAQKRTLEAIRDNGVKLQEPRVGQLRVAVNDGEKPRKDMVLWAIEQGWAVSDHSTPLHIGQPVSLTRTGEAILAR